MPDIVFGDNHFFGINHLSISKADEYKAQFSSDNALIQTFDSLARNGVQEQMISAHATAGHVCRIALDTHPTLKIHPVIPYAHAINDSAASQGVSRTAIQLLRPSFLDAIKSAVRLILPGSNVSIPRSSIARFIGNQLETFGEIPESNRGVLFMSNVFTDALIGLGAWEWFEHLDRLCQSLGYTAGVITYNPAAFLNRKNLQVSLCINYNHQGFLNNIAESDFNRLISQYPVWAMGVFGSGAYTENDVVADLRKRAFEKVVFASSKEERLSSFIAALQDQRQ